MKSEKQIRSKMVRLRNELTVIQNKNSNANEQLFEMLLGKSSKFREKENFILGQLRFATWVINK